MEEYNTSNYEFYPLEEIWDYLLSVIETNPIAKDLTNSFYRYWKEESRCSGGEDWGCIGDVDAKYLPINMTENYAKMCKNAKSPKDVEWWISYGNCGKINGYFLHCLLTIAYPGSQFKVIDTEESADHTWVVDDQGYNFDLVYYKLMKDLSSFKDVRLYSKPPIPKYITYLAKLDNLYEILNSNAIINKDYPFYLNLSLNVDNPPVNYVKIFLNGLILLSRGDYHLDDKESPRNLEKLANSDILDRWLPNNYNSGKVVFRNQINFNSEGLYLEKIVISKDSILNGILLKYSKFLEIV
jgi:hypothetical protein